MSLYYQDDRVTLHHGDCIEVMKAFPDSSVDSIVTDPPYGLGFMGKAWDTLPPGEDWARECLRVLKPGGHLLAFGGTRTWHRLAVSVEDAGFEIRDSIAWMYGSGFPKHRSALKPAFEPIVMARKPFKGSLTANEAVHRTGALNVDSCKIGNGRWPANVVLDESQGEKLDSMTWHLKAPGNTPDSLARLNASKSDLSNQVTRFERGTAVKYGDSGGASRFFYVAKAAAKERPRVDGITHPTVKPLALMRWLVRLATPEGGVVLDPFAGSGTTIEAGLSEGMTMVGIEMELEYMPLIAERLGRVA